MVSATGNSVKPKGNSGNNMTALGNEGKRPVSITTIFSAKVTDHIFCFCFDLVCTVDRGGRGGGINILQQKPKIAFFREKAGVEEMLLGIFKAILV